MTSIHDLGIVLRRLDYSETSQVLVVLTREYGKVRLIAKGIKRSTKTRFGTAIDLLDVGQVVLSVRQARQEALATLIEWEQTRSFLGLRQKLGRLHAAQYAAEVTAALTEDWDPHPRAFEAMIHLLTDLCELEDPLPALVAFAMELLEEIGLAPQFEHCVSCQRPIGRQGSVHFSSLEGGLVCRDCEGAFVEKRQVRSEVLAVLTGASAAGPGVCGGVFELIDYHLTHLMGRRPSLAGRLIAGDR